MEPGPSGLTRCLASDTGLAPGGAPWRRRSISVLRSRICAKPSETADHAASGSRDRATAMNLSPGGLHPLRLLRIGDRQSRRAPRLKAADDIGRIDAEAAHGRGCEARLIAL